VEWLAVFIVRNRRVGLLWGLMEATFSKSHAALWRCPIYLWGSQPSTALYHLL
jgi:hypothetical protein